MQECTLEEILSTKVSSEEIGQLLDYYASISLDDGVMLIKDNIFYAEYVVSLPANWYEEPAHLRVNLRTNDRILLLFDNSIEDIQDGMMDISHHIAPTIIRDMVYCNLSYGIFSRMANTAREVEMWQDWVGAYGSDPFYFER